MGPNKAMTAALNFNPKEMRGRLLVDCCTANTFYWRYVPMMYMYEHKAEIYLLM